MDDKILITSANGACSLVVMSGLACFAVLCAELLTAAGDALTDFCFCAI